MDLHFTQDAETPVERGAVDALIETAGHRGRDLLLPALHALNDRIGWISHGGLNYVSRQLGVPPAEAYGVATFYAHFSVTQLPTTRVRVCDDIACIGNGNDRMLADMQRTYGEPACLPSACLGHCDRAPAALVQHAGNEPTCTTLVSGVQHIGGSDLRLLRRFGLVDPASLDDYRAHDGYVALRRAFEPGPGRGLAAIVAAGLGGRGGAAFPTGKKMQAVAAEPARPHYLICNADESEPGAFKDRVLMESDPYAIVEAMTIAAFASGCDRGYVYVRAEYPLAFARLEHAVESARRHGMLGNDISGKGFDFDIELRRGAGAYICGEETALCNSIEGKRGEPRNKPPFPSQAGLFGKPTLIDNVETLACLPEIVLHGSASTKLFCLSGAVTQPGLYEVPLGTTLRELLALAGGVRTGKTLRAILLGGAAGTFVGPDSLGLELTFEATRAAGASIGSGVVMVFDDTTDFARIVTRIASFFRHESCGQCVPCRVGTVRQEEALRRVMQHGFNDADAELLNDVARAMRDASICGLGTSAASAVESAMTLHLLDAGPVS